jgi:hypothetical protein
MLRFMPESKLASIKLSPAQESILISPRKTLCRKCHWYSLQYSSEELVFDIKLTCPNGLRRSYTEYCVRCYATYIYPTIAPISHQKQRLDCLMNIPHYWGVLDNFTGYNFARENGYGSKTHNIGDVLWYEFPNPDPKYHGALVLAIVNLKDERSNNDYCRYRDVFSIDKHTSYIYRDLAGLYRIVYKLAAFYLDVDKDRKINCFCEFSQCFDRGPTSKNQARYFFSLEEALWFLQIEHKEYFHAGNEECNCKKISRYSYVENGVVVRNPWSLQALSAYFIKHYCCYNKREIYNLTHRNCRDIILTIDPVRSDKKWENVIC